MKLRRWIGWAWLGITLILLQQGLLFSQAPKVDPKTPAPKAVADPKTAAPKVADPKAADPKTAAPKVEPKTAAPAPGPDAKALEEAKAKAASELKALEEAKGKAAAELKALEEAKGKSAADAKAFEEAKAKAAVELKALEEARAKAGDKPAGKGEEKKEEPKAEEKKEEPKTEEKKEEEAKPSPDGSALGDRGMVIGGLSDKEKADAEKAIKDMPVLGTLLDFAGKNRAGINMMWTLITGFLVMFMQAGFALVETGLCRHKNVAHTMAMNFMVYALGMLGFWICGFALMFGGFGAVATVGGANLLDKLYTVQIMGKDFGLFGYEGFFLTGKAFDSGLMMLFLFQMVFMDTTATIPTGAMAERWKFSAFMIFGFFVSMVIYPIYGNWVWGGGWLAKLGTNFGLGHGHVDFAGSSVVHMVGGVTALAGGIIIGARIGKYNADGSPNALPAHSVPMYMLGTFILAFGWFGFNPGSSLSGADLNIARCAVTTMLASASGALTSMIYMWIRYGKPDPSFMCNGMLAGLVAITAPCAFVTPVVAVLIGAVSGVLVIWSCLFVERFLKVDDPVGAISVHGVNGAWGIIALGLFADGTYGQGWNGSFWYKYADKLYWLPEAFNASAVPDVFKGIANFDPSKVEAIGVTGLFYGNPSQFYASLIGIAANVLWVFPVAFIFFWIVEKTIGNRVTAEVEMEGLDVPEMGVLGYIESDTMPMGATAPPPVPRPATAPAGGKSPLAASFRNRDE